MNIAIFKRIAVAFAFSPRREALLLEVKRVVELQQAELFIVHVGERKEHKDSQLENLVEKLNFNPDRTHICWEMGNPAARILQVCQEQQIDLLITGAMRQKNLLQYYLGSVGRQILRNASCSVLVLTEPSKNPARIKNILVCADENPPTKTLLENTIRIGKEYESDCLHILKQAVPAKKAAWSENSAPETPRAVVLREIGKVKAMIQKVNLHGLGLHIKVTSSDPLQLLPKFVKRYNADLLVMPTPGNKFIFLHRLFRRELELLFSDLPCNLLLIKVNNQNR